MKHCAGRETAVVAKATIGRGKPLSRRDGFASLSRAFISNSFVPEWSTVQSHFDTSFNARTIVALPKYLVSHFGLNPSEAWTREEVAAILFLMGLSDAT